LQVAVKLWLLALVGCNQVYDLESTRLHDAQAPDAPYRCTDEAPDLRGKPVLIVDGRNAPRSYSISIDRRIAVGISAGTYYEGEADMPLTMGATLSPPPTPTQGSPRLAPEGDELFVRDYNPISPTAPATVDRYVPQGDIWVRQANIISFVAASPVEISAPTRRSAGPRRMLVLSSTTDLREFEEAPAGLWTQVAMYTHTELGTGEIHFPNLTPDGLHLIFEGRDSLGGPTLVYASRPSMAARFANAVDANPFFGSPQISDPFLVEDCARMYFYVPAKVGGGLYYVER